MPTKLVTSIAIFTLGTVSLFAQATQTVTGTVTDAMCGAHHMIKNVPPAQCTRTYVKQGSQYVLASGGKVYILKGEKSQFDKFSGKSVSVKGKLNGNTISADSIKAATP